MITTIFRKKQKRSVKRLLISVLSAILIITWIIPELLAAGGMGLEASAATKYRGLAVMPAYDASQWNRWRNDVASRLNFDGADGDVTIVTTEEFNCMTDDLTSSYDYIVFGANAAYKHVGEGKTYSNSQMLMELLDEKNSASSNLSGNDLTENAVERLKQFYDCGYTIEYMDGFSEKMGNNTPGDVNQTNIADLYNKTSGDLYTFNSKDGTERIKVSAASSLQINITKKPVSYADGYANSSEDKSKLLNYTFTIVDPKGTSSSRYTADFYIDTNYDGRYDEETEYLSYLGITTAENRRKSVESNALEKGVAYNLTINATDYNGLLCWKLAVADNTSPDTRFASETGACKLQLGKGQEKEAIRILQLTARKDKSGYTVNNVYLPTKEECQWIENQTGISRENIASKARACTDASLFRVYEGDNEKIWDTSSGDTKMQNLYDFYLYLYKDSAVESFDLDIDRVYINNLASTVGTNPDWMQIYSYLTDNYDMLIFGFSDCYDDITSDQVCAGIEAFIAEGKSVLFTHDTSSFVNNANGWGYNVNKYFRDILGMDRFGVTLTHENGTLYNAAERVAAGKDYNNSNMGGSSSDRVSAKMEEGQPASGIMQTTISVGKDASDVKTINAYVDKNGDYYIASSDYNQWNMEVEGKWVPLPYDYWDYRVTEYYLNDKSTEQHNNGQKHKSTVHMVTEHNPALHRSEKHEFEEHECVIHSVKKTLVMGIPYCSECGFEIKYHEKELKDYYVCEDCEKVYSSKKHYICSVVNCQIHQDNESSETIYVCSYSGCTQNHGKENAYICNVNGCNVNHISAGKQLICSVDGCTEKHDSAGTFYKCQVKDCNINHGEADWYDGICTVCGEKHKAGTGGTVTVTLPDSEKYFSTDYSNASNKYKIYYHLTRYWRFISGGGIQGYNDTTLSTSGLNGQNDASRATRINEGPTTSYPYAIGKSISTASTHSQYYQLDLESDDIVVWYALYNDQNSHYSSHPNDGRNNYYIYNKGNITYSGVGHSTGLSTDEVMLFANTMIAAYRAGDSTVSMQVTSWDASTSVTSVKDESDTPDVISTIPVDYVKKAKGSAYGEGIVTYKNQQQYRRVDFKVFDHTVASNKTMSFDFYVADNDRDKSKGTKVNYFAGTVYRKSDGKAVMRRNASGVLQPVNGERLMSGIEYYVYVPLKGFEEKHLIRGDIQVTIKPSGQSESIDISGSTYIQFNNRLQFNLG